MHLITLTVVIVLYEYIWLSLINFSINFFSASSTPVRSTSGGGTCTPGASRSAWRTCRASPSFPLLNHQHPRPRRPVVGVHKWRHRRGRWRRHRRWCRSKRRHILSTLFGRFSEVRNQFKLPSLRWTSKNFIATHFWYKFKNLLKIRSFI